MGNGVFVFRWFEGERGPSLSHSHACSFFGPLPSHGVHYSLYSSLAILADRHPEVLFFGQMPAAVGHQNVSQQQVLAHQLNSRKLANRMD